MRPLMDDRLLLSTYIAARIEEDSRVVSEFVRGVVRKLKILLNSAHERSSTPTQQRLPLVS